MAVFRRLISGIRGLVRNQQIEQELDDELRQYLETSIERKMQSGMSREQATRATRIDMGSVEAVKDGARDVGWESIVEGIWRDARFAVRILRKSPGFTAVAVLTLGLGVGANTAVFSVVNSLSLRTLPVTDPERLVTISSDFAINRGFTAGAGWNYGMWQLLRARLDAFEGGFAWTPAKFNLAERGEIDSIDGLYASGDYFSTLGVQAILGRTFTAADDVRGGGPDGAVAVISYRLWRGRFGGSRDAIGTRLVVDGASFTVIGVMPPQFSGMEVGRTFDLTLPLGTEPLINRAAAAIDEPRRLFLFIMLRLKNGQSADAATAAIRSMQPEILQTFSGTPPPFLKEPFTLVPASTGTSGGGGAPGLRQRYERSLLTVLVIVAAVLLIACVNVANLLLARTASRQRELSARLALGASPRRLARQLLVESLLLATLGAGAGLVLAAWASRALVAQLSTSLDRVVLPLPLDWRVLGFTATAGMITAILFGVAPAIRTLRMAPMHALKAQGQGGGSADTRTSVSGGLVVAQVALSLVLLVAAGLLLRTFDQLTNVPLGFDDDRVLLINVDTVQAGVDPAARNQLFHQLVGTVTRVPNVAAAAGSLWTPGSGAFNLIVDARGRATNDERRVIANFVTPSWFETFGIPLQAGRDISERDTAHALPVVIVNEAFVHRILPNREAVGETLVDSDSAILRGRTVIGVVGDAIYGSLRDPAPPTVYIPLAQSVGLQPPGRTTITITVRPVTGPPASVASAAGAALIATNRDVAFSFRTLADQMKASIGQERLAAMLSGSFAVLALVLAGVGLYGLTAYTVSRRRSEIGIRIALGARGADVVRMILRRTLWLTAIGIALGLVGAAFLTRYLEAMLFGVTPMDIWTLAAVSLMFAAVATFAAFLPARRAARTDPSLALRCE